MLLMLGVVATSFTLSLILTPLARTLATRCGLVDQPDGRRKLHQRAIPVAGGLPLLISTTAAFLLFAIFDSERSTDWPATERLIGLLSAAMAICLLGLVDDLGHLRGRHKLLGQLAAVAIVIMNGVEVRHVVCFNYTIELGLFAVPFTAFLLLGAINSLNLIDGMDGLLSTVALIICVGMGSMALIHGQLDAACIAVALAGALLGFLRYNFPPASIFLGDCGSMLIGLVVGVLAIESSLKSPATVTLAAPTALLVIPIFDTLAAILRRTLTGRSIYTTDRGHLHHCLLRNGLTNRRALAVISAFCLLTVVGALASIALKNELVALLSAIVVIAVLVTSRLFGHAEMSLVGQRLNSLLNRISRPADGSLGSSHEIEVRLHGRIDWKELWIQITSCSEQLNLSRVRLDINAPAINEGYHAAWQDGSSQPDHEDSHAIWSAEIPLSAQGRCVGRVSVVGRRDNLPIWEKIAALSQLVQEFETTANQLTERVWVVSAPEPLRAPHLALHPSQMPVG